MVADYLIRMRAINRELLSILLSPIPHPGWTGALTLPGESQTSTLSSQNFAADKVSRTLLIHAMPLPASPRVNWEPQVTLLMCPPVPRWLFLLSHPSKDRASSARKLLCPHPIPPILPGHHHAHPHPYSLLNFSFLGWPWDGGQILKWILE